MIVIEPISKNSSENQKLDTLDKLMGSAASVRSQGYFVVCLRCLWKNQLHQNIELKMADIESDS